MSKSTKQSNNYEDDSRITGVNPEHTTEAQEDAYDEEYLSEDELDHHSYESDEEQYQPADPMIPSWRDSVWEHRLSDPSLWTDSLIPTRPKPTEEEIQREYEALCARDKADAENYKLQKWDELVAWTKSIGKTPADIPGTFEDQIEEMDILKHQAFLKREEARKAREEADRLARLQSAPKPVDPRCPSKGQQEYNQNRYSKRFNSHGKDQGTKLVVPKKKNVKPVLPIVPKSEPTPYLSAEDVEDDAEELLENEPMPLVGISVSMSEFLVPVAKEEPKVVLSPVQEEEGWTTIGRKKSEPKEVPAKITKVLEIYGGILPECVPVVKAPKAEVEAKPSFTRMCSFHMEGKKCVHGKNCRFAHSVSQLTPPTCKWGKDCRHGKTCTFIHGGETVEEYAYRLGYTKVKPPPKPIVPVKIVLEEPKEILKASEFPCLAPQRASRTNTCWAVKLKV